MTVINVYDNEPEFGWQRDGEGDILLTIKADDTRITINVGHEYDAVTTVQEGLRKLAEDLYTQVVDGWEDIPEEWDARVTADRGEYLVSIGGKDVTGYPTRDIAVYELARRMADAGEFGNAWYYNEHGTYDNINDEVRKYHDEGGDKLLPLPGVQYQDGATVDYGDPDFPWIVDRDYGPLGVRVHASGDPDVNALVTDRTELKPYSGDDA